MMDNNSFLPFGPTLKPLISHSTMSDADLREFINSKGIFLSDYSREIVVPILEVSLITPNDFIKLKDKNKKKEDKIKNITKAIPINKDFSLIDALSDYEFDADENSSFKNYSFINKPELTEEDKSCVFDYRIKRYDAFKGWTEQETEHLGTVVFKKKDKYLEIEAFSEHTSSETKKINEEIINDIKKHLTLKNYVNTGEKLKYIKYDDFTNKERLEFLLLFRDLKNINIKINNVADVIFAPDVTQDITQSNLSWMEDKVKKLILSGNKLDEISYLKEEDNYQYIIIETIIIKYNFSLHSHSGDLSVQFGFPYIIKKFDPMTEFQFQIEGIHINEEEGRQKVKMIEKEIARIINEAKEIIFETIIKRKK